MSKKVLITGTSGGFGMLSVKALLEKGHKVTAAMRNTNTKNKEVAAELKNAGAHVVEIDVTDDNSVNNGVQDAINAMGGLDVVVNNAGVGVLGMQEHFTPEDFKKLFDVNVFGVQRVNRAAIPHLRKNNSGLIIYISSLLGRMCLPFYGPYNASKWALEAVAENYRTELSGFGIENCLVEPGGFPTSFFDKLIQPGDQSRNAEYGEFINAPKQMFDAFEGALAGNPDQKPENVAHAVLNLIESGSGKRPFRTTVDKMGMGDALKQYNEDLENIHKGILGNFEMAHMLETKVPA
ncbi:MAG: SDR family NAD(P)-dependent oxidoreductase [Bacteroidia bacterium]|nr:SDR family NAD(P)-dependent oxidoreductase [Bacteroidia bacterium]